jgi:hypothetical protein
LSIGGASANAQSIEPRVYSPVPTGSNFLVVAASEARGAIPIDPALPLSDIDFKVHSIVGGYARSFDLFGRTGKLDFVLPHGTLDGSANFHGEPIGRKVSGFLDPLARLSILFHGAPALSSSEFRGYRQGLVIGASVQLSIPVGQYDEERLLNLGTNRWALKPEIGLSKAWGPWAVEAAGGVTLFGDNEDFFGGHTRSQKPIYSIQTHVIRNLKPGQWVSANLTWFGGGKTSVDGISDQNLQKNWRAGLTAAMPISRQLSVKANASTGVSARTGNNFDLYGISLQYRWGV